MSMSTRSDCTLNARGKPHPSTFIVLRGVRRSVFAMHDFLGEMKLLKNASCFHWRDSWRSCCLHCDPWWCEIWPVFTTSPQTWQRSSPMSEIGPAFIGTLNGILLSFENSLLNELRSSETDALPCRDVHEWKARHQSFLLWQQTRFLRLWFQTNLSKWHPFTCHFPCLHLDQRCNLFPKFCHFDRHLRRFPPFPNVPNHPSVGASVLALSIVDYVPFKVNDHNTPELLINCATWRPTDQRKHLLALWISVPSDRLERQRHPGTCSFERTLGQSLSCDQNHYQNAI